MEKLKVKVAIGKDAALRAGKTQWGETTLVVDDEALAELTPDERVRLAGGSFLRARAPGEAFDTHRDALDIDGAEVTWAAAVAALRAVMAREMAVAAREAAEKKASIAEALAKPDADWLARGDRFNQPRVHTPPGFGSLAEEPEIQARLRDVAARLLEPATNAWNFDRAQEELRRQEEALAAADIQARAEKRKLSCAATLRELAKSEDDLSRAATEQYPIEWAMLDRLAEKLMGLVKDKLGQSAFRAQYDHLFWNEGVRSERPAPKPDAFALLDAVTAAAKLANENHLHEGLHGWWGVSRILRLDTCGHEGSKRHHYVTAVLATLELPAGNRQVTFSTEAIDCPGHEDFEEE